jgi:hypothetical protein
LVTVPAKPPTMRNSTPPPTRVWTSRGKSVIRVPGAPARRARIPQLPAGVP